MAAMPSDATVEYFDVPGANESSTALHMLSVFPFTGEAPILYHYPAMKLGIRSGIRFCADQLGTAASAIFAQHMVDQDWLIVSPPRFILPGAANLLARAIHRDLAARGRRNLGLAELRLTPLAGTCQKIESSSIYARSGFQDRVQSRQRLHDRLDTPDPTLFGARSVLFINDINVTGAQQHFMRQALRAAGVASIHWLYLVQVSSELGRAQPGIEHELNYSRFGAFEEFAEVLVHEDIDFTARCINRLFDYEDALLLPLFRTMNPARKALLLRLAAEEGRYQGRDEDYWSKLARIGV